MIDKLVIDEDIVVRMSPRESYKVRIKVKSNKKGELRIVEPLEVELKSKGEVDD